MFRRSIIRLAAPLRGAPPKRDRKASRVICHASQRGPEPSDINFSELGLSYPPTKSMEVSPYGFSEPPSTPPTEYPFMVERTSVGKMLPVYTDYRNGRTRVLTILRKVSGDVKVLHEEMEKVCGKEVMIRPGNLVVVGHYRRRLQKWLTGLGF